MQTGRSARERPGPVASRYPGLVCQPARAVLLLIKQFAIGCAVLHECHSPMRSFHANMARAGSALREHGPVAPHWLQRTESARASLSILTTSRESLVQNGQSSIGFIGLAQYPVPRHHQRTQNASGRSSGITLVPLSLP